MAAERKTGINKKTKTPRAKLPPVSDQMKAWSAALGSEVAGWPSVSARSFFGFTALYRNERMFAALPRTRAMQTPNSLVFKLVEMSANSRAKLEKDPRVGDMQMQKARWYAFELASDRDLHDALDWIGQAYDAVGKSKTLK
jgi:hypothetical protein